MPKHWIYKLYCKNGSDETYVGSTNDLKKRIQSHKSGCKRSNQLVYCVIRGNGGWSNWNYEILETIEECTRDEAYIKEQCWIEKINPTLNCCSARLPAYNKNNTWQASALKRFLRHEMPVYDMLEYLQTHP